MRLAIKSFLITFVVAFAIFYPLNWYLYSHGMSVGQPVYPDFGGPAVELICDGSPVSKLYHFCPSE